MPSRPVLIGRGLVTHPPHTHLKNKCPRVLRVHYPESEPTTHPQSHGAQGHVHNRTTVHHVTAAIAAGKHPDPSRTRKLSQPAPMVLHPIGCGRVGRRRTIFVDGGHLRMAPIAIVGRVRRPSNSPEERARGRRSSSFEQRRRLSWAIPGWAIRQAEQQPFRQASLR